MEKPLVSIIVPIYNAEASLYACVRSICSQKYENIEILLVNDGSRDDSLNICRAFSAGDERIRIIDKPNSGVSSSRNMGIEAAKGKYLRFVDSDDYITPESTQLMVERAESTNCDLVIAEFFRVVGRRIIASSNIGTNELLTGHEFARCFMDTPHNFYYGVMWNKLYRRELILRYAMRCCEELTWCEDFLFNIDYYYHMQTVATLNTPVYYYVKRRGSLANSYDSTMPTKTFRMKRAMYAAYKEFFESMEMYQQYRTQIRMFFIEFARDGGVSPFAPQEAEKACQQARKRGEQYYKKRASRYKSEQQRARIYKPRTPADQSHTMKRHS